MLANGGLWGYWTYPMPHGAFVPSKMRNARAAGEFTRARRDVCLHTRSARWTAVLDAEPRAGLFGSSQNFWGAAKALIALHRSPDVIDESDLAPGDALRPDRRSRAAGAHPRHGGQAGEFVRRGGKLLSTGISIRSPEMQRLLGVKLVKAGEIVDGHVLLQGGGPAGVYAPWDRLELAGAEELYPLYRAWDDTNPQVGKIRGCYPITGMVDEEDPEKAGFPAATIRRLDQGVAVHLATASSTRTGSSAIPTCWRGCARCWARLQPQPLFQTNALSFVEVRSAQATTRSGAPGQRQPRPRPLAGRRPTISGWTTSRRSGRSPAAFAARRAAASQSSPAACPPKPTCATALKSSCRGWRSTPAWPSKAGSGPAALVRRSDDADDCLAAGHVETSMTIERLTTADQTDWR